jgi:hypothetical protein
MLHELYSPISYTRELKHACYVYCLSEYYEHLLYMHNAGNAEIEHLHEGRAASTTRIVRRRQECGRAVELIPARVDYQCSELTFNLYGATFIPLMGIL